MAGAGTVVASFYAARRFTNPTNIGLLFAPRGDGGRGVGPIHVRRSYLRRRVALCIRITLSCGAGSGTVVASFYAARRFTSPTGIGLHFAHKGEGGSGVGLSHVLDP